MSDFLPVPDALAYLSGGWSVVRSVLVRGGNGRGRRRPPVDVERSSSAEERVAACGEHEDREQGIEEGAARELHRVPDGAIPQG